MTASTVTLTPETNSTTVSGAGAIAETPVLTGQAIQLLRDAFAGIQQLSSWSTTPPIHIRGKSFSTTREAFMRIRRPGYSRWLNHVQPAAGCSKPIRLQGENTVHLPDGVVYKSCGNRRASVCPSCAETYRADTYQLIIAGLNGGKGVPESVKQHPCAFPTFTAPSFGVVHSTRMKNGQPQICRPGRKPRICPHGVDLRCPLTHREGEKQLGRALCLDCYDHAGQVVWNVMAGELWRQTMEAAKGMLTRIAKAEGVKVRFSFAKAAEMQARGVAHFHALVRLDGIDPENPTAVVPPPAGFNYQLLARVIEAAVEATSFTTLPHPDKPEGWEIAWGKQLLIKPVRQGVEGEVTDTAVAGYLAKYATKATETAGHVSRRIKETNIGLYALRYTHTGRLIRACWELGRPGSNLDPERAAQNSGRLSYERLRRWAHMLGFGGHFSSKSRQYSTTLKALREVRQIWRQDQYRTAEHTDEETTLIVGTLTYAGTGWKTTGDALLANSAAAQAREYRRVAKEETS